MAKSADSPADSPAPDYAPKEYKVIPGSEIHAPDEIKLATTYTIKSGDSLSGIAQEQLGDASRWKEIYELNKDVHRREGRLADFERREDDFLALQVRLQLVDGIGDVR